MLVHSSQNMPKPMRKIICAERLGDRGSEPHVKPKFFFGMSSIPCHIISYSLQESVSLNTTVLSGSSPLCSYSF